MLISKHRRQPFIKPRSNSNGNGELIMIVIMVAGSGVDQYRCNAYHHKGSQRNAHDARNFGFYALLYHFKNSLRRTAAAYPYLIRQKQGQDNIMTLLYH